MKSLLVGALALVAWPALADPLLNRPVYDGATKSYFALIDGRQHRSRYHSGFVWDEARNDAATREYGGVRGRMATISSIETHLFLLNTFHPTAPTWIGIRYDCAARRLIDSSDHVVPKDAFAAWDKNWKQDQFVCTINRYMHTFDVPAYAPIAYSAPADGFRWIAKGPQKVYDYYFIEFPTGHP